LDDFSRNVVALVVDNSLSGVRVARELDRAVEMRGKPCMFVSDNGTEADLALPSRMANKIAMWNGH